MTPRKPRQHTRERHSQLLNLINNGSTAVSDLADALDISESTVRRDLDRLRQGKKIERTYGGAVATQTFREYSFSESEHRAALAKNAIAERALHYLPREGTIFLDAGTTCAALARRIAADAQYRLTIVTRGLEATVALAEATHIELILLGGTLRRMSHGLVGALTMLALERLQFDLCFLGADAVNTVRGIGEPTLEETRIKEKIAQHSGQVFVLADASKLDAIAPPAWTCFEPGWTWISDAPARPFVGDNRCILDFVEI